MAHAIATRRAFHLQCLCLLTGTSFACGLLHCGISHLFVVLGGSVSAALASFAHGMARLGSARLADPAHLPSGGGEAGFCFYWRAFISLMVSESEGLILHCPAAPLRQLQQCRQSHSLARRAPGNTLPSSKLANPDTGASPRPSAGP